MVHFTSIAALAALGFPVLTLAVPTVSGVTKFTSSGSVEAGFKIPENFPDGVYIVQIDASGAHHTKLADIDASSPAPALFPHDSPAATLETIQSRQVHQKTVCGGYGLNFAEADIAVGALASLCGNGREIPAGYHLWAKSVSTVAYDCNQGGGPIGCLSQGIYDVIRGYVSQTCGGYVAGYANFHSPPFSIGQERVNGDNNFCGIPH